MREIKFRAHDLCGRFVYGSLIKGFLKHNEEGHQDVIYFTDEEKITHKTAVVENTVGQYTGLKDAKGVEIYEGDVFDVCDELDNGLYIEDVHENCVVFYSEEWAGFCYGNAEHEVYDRLSELEGLEVIGNIYDNPELLSK